ncbi:MAG: hypothetical protein JO295_03595 [Verrucomicrobia bacterium]|nr:hypothetical protein [Verrucomicrobiota bacterium]
MKLAQQAPLARKRPGRHITRFPNLMAHARALGVERSHLYRVLLGQRPSARLLRRYRELVAQEMSLAAA